MKDAELDDLETVLDVEEGHRYELESAKVCAEQGS